MTDTNALITAPSTPQQTGESVLRIDNLSVSFQQGSQRNQAVRNVSLELKKGETFALVGESGSGKSVTAMAILKLLPRTVTHYDTGTVLFEGRNLLAASEPELRRIRGNRIGMIFQEPLTALNPLHTVEKQIGEVLRIHKGLDGQQARKRILELLTLVGIPQPETRLGTYPHQLSGGQRQRVMIAMALANDPDILIADEPTTALDVTIQKQVLNLLQDLQSKLGMTILIITHDLGIVRRFAHRVAVMTKGEIVETNTTDALFRQPTHPYTQMLLAAEPKGLPVTVDPANPTIMQVQSLRVWFPVRRGVFKQVVGHIKAVDDISFSLQQGSTLGVVGESGSGKTTLVQALLKLTDSTGSVNFENTDLIPLNSRQIRPLRRRMQIVFQDPFSSLSPRMSVGEIVREGLDIHHIGVVAEREQRVIDALNEVGLDPAMRHRFPHEFSGGQRQRIAIARSIILKPKVIVLDEPTSALDRSVQRQVIELLRDLQQKHGLSYIFISHDLSVIRDMSDHVIVMKDGKIVEQGDTGMIFDAPRADYTKTLIAAAFTH